MDGFAFHPYEDNSSVAPVSGTHPNTTTIALADYDKLVALLGAAFGDYTMPIWYDEFGVETQIPVAKQSFYINDGAGGDEAGRRGDAGGVLPAGGAARVLPAERSRALPLPRVRRDATSTGWQSGLYYADDTPKTSLDAVRLAMERVAPRRRRALRRRSAAHRPSEGRAARRGPHAHVRPRLLVRRPAVPAAGPAARHEARPRDRGQADDAAVASPEDEGRRTGCGSRRSRR